MSRPISISVFLVLCVAQLWAAGSGIASYENTLKEGRVYRFKCAPVDPEDPFRGRYVRLQLDAARTNLSMPGNDENMFAVLEDDDAGFAVITQLLADPSDVGDYIQVQASGHRWLPLKLPFDRYFMEESQAPAAEHLYWKKLRDRNSDVYLSVRVLDGESVIEGLFIDGTAIEQLLLEDAG